MCVHTMTCAEEIKHCFIGQNVQITEPLLFVFYTLRISPGVSIIVKLGQNAYLYDAQRHPLSIPKYIAWSEIDCKLIATQCPQQESLFFILNFWLSDGLLLDWRGHVQAIPPLHKFQYDGTTVYL